MNAYVYQADLLCEPCAQAVLKLLRDTDADLVQSQDSDDSPQGPVPNGGGESACPQHCGYCQVFLENPLTAEGRGYIRDILADEQDDELDSIARNTWAPFYGIR